MATTSLFYPPSRLGALTDAVFAVVIVLLTSGRVEEPLTENLSR